MSDIYSYSEDGILSWSEPMRVKRFGVLLAMKNLNLFIGWVLVSLLLYWLLNWMFGIEGTYLWIGVCTITFFFSYFTLFKQLFVSDQVVFEETRLGIKRSGVWTYSNYQNIKDIIFFSQNVRGTTYPILSFIDEDGKSQQVFFLNKKQFESVKEFMFRKEIITKAQL